MAENKDLKENGWMSREPDKFRLIRETIEKAKSTPPSREYVQEQIDHIYQGAVYFDRIIAALQALLELVEANKTDKP